MKKIFLPAMAALVVLPAMLLAGCGGSDDEVITVYVGRSQQLIEPLLNDFAEDTGIKIDVRYGDGTDLALGILEEGDNSPADIYYGQDVGALGALISENRLAPLSEKTLNTVEPQFRSPDGLWVGISGRARVVVYNTDKVKESDLPDSIFDYTDPKWRGKVGIIPRSDGFPEFVTAMRVIRGEEFTEQWLRELVANNPRAYANNIAAIQAVNTGEVQVAFLNHYYLYRFLEERGDSFKVRNYFFESADLGGLFLVSGAAVLESSKNKDAAERFIQWMLEPKAQEYLAKNDYEYPMLAGVAADPELPPLSSLSVPDVDLSDLGDLRGSLELMRKTGMLP